MIREYLICLAMLGAVFAASVIVPFTHHDQYRYFTEDYGDPRFKKHCYNDTQNGSLRTLGRPLAAKLECTVFFHTFKQRHLSYFRVLALLVMGLTVLILSRWFQGMGMGAWYARLLGVGLMCLPGGQNAIFMANLPNVFTPLLAISGGILAVRANRPRIYIGAWLLVGVAFFIYSPMIMHFFVPLLAAMILDTKTKDALWKTCLRSGGVFIAAAAVFFTFGRKKYLSNPEAMPEQYQLKISPGLIPENLPRFFETILPMELKAWDVYFEIFGPVLLGLGLLVLLLPSNRRRGAAALGLLMFLGANVLFLCSKAYILYRVAWPAMAMLAILALGPSLLQPRAWLRRLAGVGLALGLCLTAFNNYRNVMNSYLEFQLVKEAVAKAPPDTNAIHVIMPGKEKGFNGMPQVTADEYNVPSSSFHPGFIMEMIRLAFIELNREGVLISTLEVKPRLETFEEIELRPKDESEYTLHHGQDQIGVLRTGTRPKIIPWEARAGGPLKDGALNFYKLGTWRKADGTNDLAGRWKIENMTQLIYVSAALQGEPAPEGAYIIDLASHIPQ